MLWYKTWLETRSRFLTSLCGITIIISFFVHHAESLFPAGPKKTSVCNIIFFAHQYLVGIWILSVILLGMGGLVRERALGTSSLTLALPVSRARLAGVRIAVGMLQAISLAVFPWVSILLITDLGQVSFPISQASFYLALLISGGMIYFALAVLISTCIEGEYTAPAVSYGLTILTGMVFGEVKWIRPYADLWRFMGGDNHITKNTYLLSGPFPWLGFSASLCVAGLMLLASVWVLQKQEF